MTKRVFSTLLAGLLLFAACGKDDDNDGRTVGEWVDLGLPSGLLWYSVNLGAIAPEGYGNYYAWGETTPKNIYDWGTYIHCNGDGNKLTKYCTIAYYGDNSFTDGKTTLEAMDDAAAQVLGNGARTPRKDEWEELLNHTTSEWGEQNGVYGRRFFGENGSALFLPAAGYRCWDSELDLVGDYGDYWSASLLESGPNCAWYLNFRADYQTMHGSSRNGGFSVRAVRSAH